MKKIMLKMVSVSLLFVGCGDSGSSTSSQVSEIPSTYTNKVINNRGLAVEGTIDGYGIKIYSDSKEDVNPQQIHKGVVVKLNGKTSEVMPIEIAYLNKNIVVSLLNDKGEEVAVSEEIKVTDVPVVVVEMNL